MRPHYVEVLNQYFGTTVFSYLVPNYLIMLSIAVTVGAVYAAHRAKQVGLKAEHVYGMTLWSFPAALLGARLLHVLYAAKTYSGGVLTYFDPLQGDSVGYGGYLAGITAGLFYLHYRHLAIWRYADVATPAIGLGIFLGRLGCFLDGDDFGAISDSPLAVRFPSRSPAYHAHFAMGMLSDPVSSSLPVHPVQLYLALNGLVLGAIAAFWSRGSRGRAHGETFCLFWLLYACARFALEFFRGDEARGFVGPFSTSQIISVPVAMLAATLAWHRYKTRAVSLRPSV
ncbi:MAG: prolipoprotein diacylglyceryl transferase [Acidobacteria bacterium]|nr:prolipoprotein diacylglyceryl transferase [Acidobacteriota bacterium]